MRLRALTVALVALAGVPMAGPPSQAAPTAVNPAPGVVPALREWSGGTGSFALSKHSQLIVADRSLAEEGQAFADDLQQITGQRLPVGRRVRAGDVVLRLGHDGPEHQEGYALAIGDTIEVLARTETGVSRGLQTVLQLASLGSIPKGTATDWPEVGQRGFMLDAGRKYYTPSYIEQQIRTAAWYKLDTVHLHLTEWNAFRLDSPRFPGLAAEQAYTRADIRRFEAAAARNHVRIVAEIDLPAHASAIANRWPQTKWDCASMNGTPWSSLDGFTLDVTEPATRTVVKELLDEFIPWFDGAEFHVGTDEYPYQDKQEQCPELVRYAAEHGFATTADVMVDFINFMDSIVRSHGKRTVIWNWWDVNQSPVTQPDPRIKVEAWTGSPDPYLAKGYDVVSSPSDRLYVTPGSPPGAWLVPDNGWLHGEWRPSGHPRLAGYMISRWSDSAETAPDAYHDWFAHRAQQVFADRAWRGPARGSHLALENAADLVGPPPGVFDGFAATPPDGERVRGTPYGTGPAWGGSDATYDKVFDGNPATFFDYAHADGGYAGIDAGRPVTVTKVRVLPRSQASGHLSRMTGGRIQGCIGGPATGCVDLATIRWRAPGYDWLQLPVTGDAAYRWLRYLSPDGSFGNVAEVEFYTAPQFMTVQVPETLRALGDDQLRAVVHNPTGRVWHDVTVTVRAAPADGGEPLPLAPKPIGTVPAGATRTVSWPAGVGLGTPDGPYRVVATATWQHGRARATAATRVLPAITTEVSPDPVLLDGTTATATVTVRSLAGRALDVRWSARPSGITVTPASGSVRIEAGGSRSLGLTFTGSGRPGTHPVRLSVTAASGSSYADAPATVRVSVPYPDLASAYDNVGTTDDGAVDPPGLAGGVDGDGSSYSAQALAAVGATPGGTVSHRGIPFRWPAAPPGTPDNVLANGQTIRLSGTGTTLGLLTVGTYGTRIGGTGTVRYADGTTQDFEIFDPDWQGVAPSWAEVALRMPYHNWTGAGRVDRDTFVFFHSVPLDPAKAVASVTLPTVGSVATGGTPALHVWSLAVA